MGSDKQTTIWAVVVTFNRKALLIRCISALHDQSLSPDHILIVDNASSDGSAEALESAGLLGRTDTTYRRLEENRGGAGGFADGIAYALEQGADWIWAMDDDAIPEPDALESLMAVQPSSAHVYASIAGSDGRLAWPLKPLNEHPAKMLLGVSEVPDVVEVENVPFLGLLVHRDLIRRLGVPCSEFFIAADDTEFCVRARKNGARIFAVGTSRISHPNSQLLRIGRGSLSMTYLDLPPWKRYYDTRNRLFIAKRHYGYRLWTRTLPGALGRGLVAISRGPRRRAQLKATVAGIFDGLTGRAGRRHDFWELLP
ncbi:glycosyltransferase family 2 protein [Luteibacter sp.]|jgi:GT2 family glycosyltransferase|uniref:glycosyltransferase family 2 protein n=1 Tax=Luteibacter sp. TaxID=1886636 RepID=UPI002F41800E